MGGEGLGITYDIATFSTIIWIFEEIEAFGCAFGLTGILFVNEELGACRAWTQGLRTEAGNRDWANARRWRGRESLEHVSGPDSNG